MQSDAPLPVSLAVARAAIAACMLGDEPTQLRIGDITLHPHQRSAVARIQRALSEHGGALLCDDVGVGKTYVALAVADGYDAVTIIAPATLAGMWQRALSVTRTTAEFVSIESLGRNGAPERKRTLIIVDEAHHFRNPCTRRYSALARMCMVTPVLLLTATPLHNSRDDVSAIAALFTGSRAYAMTDAQLAPMLIRRDGTVTGRAHDIPIVEHVQPRLLNTDDDVLDMIMALPAPVPPNDGSVATRLVVHGLMRQRASSNAALVGALKRRIARSHGLLASLDAGRYPTAAELTAWVYTSDAVQLAFAELLLPAATPLAAITTALREHVAALTKLLSVTRHSDDDALTNFVRAVRAAHPGEKVVAFSCYAETVEALYRSLKRDGNAALLTARGAMIASGPIGRNEIIAQFTPNSAGTRVVSEREEVSLLLATDLLSEGVNLQDASIIIHLDVPWTAARVEQRIGRLARMGSRHQRVVSYSVSPPPRAEAFLHELEILTRKADLSARVLGGSANSNFSGQSSERAAIVSGECVRAIMERWHDASHHTSRDCSRPMVALASAARAGAIGAWSVDGVPQLITWNEPTGIETGPAAIEIAVKFADAAHDESQSSVNPAQLPRVVLAVRAWYDQHCAWLAVGGTDAFPGTSTARDTRHSLARMADAASAVGGFARRSESAVIAARLRRAATTPLPLAVEWSLESLSEFADDAAVNTILDLVERARPAADRVREQGIRCIALILFAAKPPAPPQTVRTSRA
ncbi:MAG TPA: DEAD/DEAH box helicase [Gemmatimonadaceae bacterium]